MRTVLTIAGYDPSSGAGVTADLMVFAAHGLFGTSAITAMTVQSTLGVRSTHPLQPELLRETLSYLHADLPPAGVKIGMLATAEIVEVVADYLETLAALEQAPAVVLDPVLRSSSGRELLDAAGTAFLRERLLPQADWVTPNLAELGVLAGREVADHEQMLDAARSLQETRPGLGIVATGGHRVPPDDLVLAPGKEPLWLPGKHVETTATHGTGCAFSSAFLSGLVLGLEDAAAARAAKEYVSLALRSAEPIGHGRGPLNLLARLRESAPR